MQAPLGRFFPFSDRVALIDKIDWEGGLEQALEYGISSADMPDPELVEAWERLETAWRAFVKVREQVYNILDF